MLHVKTPEEVLALIESEFAPVAETEPVSLGAAMGRILAEDIAATEYVLDQIKTINTNVKTTTRSNPKNQSSVSHDRFFSASLTGIGLGSSILSSIITVTSSVSHS